MIVSDVPNIGQGSTHWHREEREHDFLGSEAGDPDGDFSCRLHFGP